MSRTTDMILELSRANIAPDSNLFIKYGNGSLNVNLALLLPCSDSDFKRLTAFIDKIDDYTDSEAAVGFIWRYVVAMNTELNRIKETYPAGDTKSRAECQKLINRFEKYMQVLTDKYSYMLPEAEAEKTPEKRQRAKSADIYTLSVNTRAAYAEPEIKVYSGKIITAVDGVQYGIYKADKGLYKIIDIYTGLSVGASAHSVAECKEVLTAELCARVAECRTKDNYKIYLSNFTEAMTAAGYADYIIPYSAADPEPAPAPAAEQDNTPAEAEQAEQAEQAEPYNIDYDALLRRFGERYAQLYDMNGAEYDWQTYRDALHIFDNGMNPRDKATLRKFVELRHDYVSSDREAVAFMLALVDVLNAPETPETAPEPDNTYLPAETETAPETAPETAENAPEDPIIEFNPELLEIARYFFYAVYSDTLSADGVQYIGSECGTRGNRLRIYISGSEYEKPETVHSNAELYSFMIENILNAEDYSYLSGIGQHYYEMLAAYTPEPPAPEPTTGAGTPAGIAGTPADTTGGTPAGMQAETTGGTAGTPETTAAGIAPARYITALSLSMADYIHIYGAGAYLRHITRQNAPRHITAALYPDPVIIAGIPPALYNMPRRNKTASALLYSTPAYMRHRRHAARINAIYRAPPALKRLRQRIRGMIDSEKPPARYYRISARRQNNQIYISWRRSIIRQNMRGYIDNMAPECRTPERQQAIKRARTRQNGAGYIRQCRSTRTAARQ